MARLSNYCCRRKATMSPFCIVSVNTTVNDDLMAVSCRRKTCLHVKFPMFLPDFNQIWIFATNFHRSPQYQVSRKSFQWEEGRTWQGWHMVFASMRKRRNCDSDTAKRGFVFINV